MASERLKTIHRHLSSRQLFINPYPNHVSAYSHQALGSSNEFRYTLDNNKLTRSQKQFYEENGYLVVPGIVDDNLIEECRLRFLDYCEGRVPKGNVTVMKDISLAKTNAKGEYLINKLQNILWDDVFAKYFLLPELLDYVECFTGPNIMAMHSMLINKPPDSGLETSQHPPHQDLHYFPFRPADRIVASWTAMERVTKDNGCLFVVPGSHKGVLLKHEYPKYGVNKAYHGIQGYDHVEKLELPMEKGDTVFFHPILIHGSGVNRTKGFRKAISCHYAASECEYIDVRGTIQEEVAREVEDMAKMKGLQIDFQDVWKYRSRLARGQAINL
ncbi:phytanoyl-CoA dioxygenase, peroxisomal-like [Ischnura elegans]|uniref:phytanoyl-CoA dioxygenase, peroxisomal-like n=1 Tax=Ischnura elegans TaxID=197161 RepID=UPI001ED89421|nr:phytanoyl-CoA dioxygenase, peroxisomal-like [Ischnura elegans]XP_046390699.1 phytanoyl-CoA dioxygenase, peroxisomal-like [Ischnura elegans]